MKRKVSVLLAMILLATLVAIPVLAQERPTNGPEAVSAEEWREFLATQKGSRWYFLLSATTEQNFVVVGPFKNPLDCYAINGWAKKQSAKVSGCWNSGE